MSIFAKVMGAGLALWLAAAPATAQEFSARARVDAGASAVRSSGDDLVIELALSQPVPWRVFTLDAPRRLVLDFREVDWGETGAEELLQGAGAVRELRLGTMRAGWSRMVLDLAGPMTVGTAGMRVSESDGSADLTLRLSPSDESSFAARAGTPEGPGWDLPPVARQQELAPESDSGALVVVVDPGHGGVDPGAQRAGTDEADLMLRFGKEFAEALTRAGMRPVLTRTEDVFVPLQQRMTLARRAGADVFLSLHADALEGDQAAGATVYSLSESGSDRASERMAERHGRGDLLAGLDLSGQDDTVATVLMDLARLETGPASERLAQALVAELQGSGAPLTSRPHRKATLAVLSAADFASALVEVGFLSNADDRERLMSAEGRAEVIEGLVAGLEAWTAKEAALESLKRR